MTCCSVSGFAGSASWTTACTRLPHSGSFQTKDHDVDDVVMFGERGLHFGRENVGTSGHDHVDAPICHVQIAVLVDSTDVAPV